MCAFDKERIEKLIKSGHFIPGIHNYCDRWCERCLFTTRCLSCELSEDHFDSPESKDINNREFWDKLHEVFSETLQMVKEHAKEMGLGLDDTDYEELERQKQQIDAEAQNHPCAKAAKEYAAMAGDQLEASGHLFEEKQNQLQSSVEMELPDSDPSGESRDISDAVEVIQWYQHFIYVKLIRALHGLLRSGADDFERDDANGSAKVALEAINRSICAWGRLLEHFPQQEEELLSILVHLQRLRLTTENAFPDARAFIRPGLDEQ